MKEGKRARNTSQYELRVNQVISLNSLCFKRRTYMNISWRNERKRKILSVLLITFTGYAEDVMRVVFLLAIFYCFFFSKALLLPLLSLLQLWCTMCNSMSFWLHLSFVCQTPQFNRELITQSIPLIVRHFLLLLGLASLSHRILSISNVLYSCTLR